MHPIYNAISDFMKDRSDKNLTRHISALIPTNAREVIFEGKTYVNFSGNDYLGLRFHSELINASQEWAGKYGAGSGASRLVTGSFDLYDTVERKIAKWKNHEACLIMNSGFQCNASVLPSLFDKKTLGAEPLIFADKLIHASMHQGCKTAGVKQIRFHHNDATHLSTLMTQYKDDPRPKFILTESVFSMDGDIAPLDTLYKLRDQHNAFLIVDEAHACGVLGDNGKGLADKADLAIGTCGKALGSFGAYVACKQSIKDYLINHCGGLIYSTALPPSTIGAINTAIDLMPSLGNAREHVLTLAENFRTELTNMGFDCGQSQTQIVPLILGDADKTIQMASTLKENGLWASAIRPPTVPQGSSRIRFAFSAAHRQEDVTQLLNIISDTNQKAAA